MCGIYDPGTNVHQEANFAPSVVRQITLLASIIANLQTLLIQKELMEIRNKKCILMLFAGAIDEKSSQPTVAMKLSDSAWDS